MKNHTEFAGSHAGFLDCIRSGGLLKSSLITHKPKVNYHTIIEQVTILSAKIHVNSECMNHDLQPSWRWAMNMGNLKIMNIQNT